MNAAQYRAYMKDQKKVETVELIDIDDPVAHTLAYGYTADRDSWHAYTTDDELHVLLYDRYEQITHVHGEKLPAYLLRPNKRVYPDTVDDQFARLMRDLDYELPLIGNFDFNSPDVARRQSMGLFKGKTHLDF